MTIKKFLKEKNVENNPPPVIKNQPLMNDNSDEKKREREIQEVALLVTYEAVIKRNHKLIKSLFLEKLKTIRETNEDTSEQLKELERIVETFLKMRNKA